MAETGDHASTVHSRAKPGAAEGRRWGADIDVALRERMTAELLPGETFEGVGGPEVIQGKIWDVLLTVIILYAVIIYLFANFAIDYFDPSQELHRPKELSDWICLSVIFLVSLSIAGAVVSPSIYHLIERHRSKNSVYVITDRRILKIIVWHGLIVESVLADRIGSVVRHESRRGGGRVTVNMNLRNRQDGNTPVVMELLALADPAGAEAVIERLKPCPPAAA